MWFLRNDSRPLKRAKGKEKETDASERGTAPINVLLGLLSKETILVNSQLVDSLLALISTATKPLLWIARNKAVDTTAKPVTTATDASKEAATSTEMVRSGGPNANISEATPAAAAATSSNTSGGAATPAAPKSAQPGGEERENTVPDIPAERLRNLVKPLATAISSKGFQNTLAIAWHVDLLEDARPTICGALREQANQASRSLVGDLDALLSTLPEPVEEEEEEDPAAADKKAGASSGEGDLTPGAAATAAAAAASAGVTQSGIVISGPTVTDRLSAMSGAQRIESKALATLASPANAQAVLLRSLRALNYIMTGR